MKPGRTFRSLFYPTLIELLFFVLMGTVDTLMLSNVGDSQVGAVGNANIIIQMFAVLLLVVANGVAVLVAQYLGAGKEDIAKNIAGNGLVVNAVFGFLIAGILFVFRDPILILMRTDESLITYSSEYISLIAVSLFFVAMSNVVTATLRSSGYARLITMAVMMANILNILGNAVLINGLFGFPALGVKGAAISTLIVRVLLFVSYMIMFSKVLNIRREHLLIRRPLLKQMFVIGLPSALESFTYTVMQVVIMGMVNTLGPQMTTSRIYINTMLSYIYVTSLAFAQTNAVLTGHLVGARDFIQARKTTAINAIRSMIVVLVVTLSVNMFSSKIIGIFTVDQVIRESVTRILWLAVFLELGRASNLVLIQALRAAGDTSFPLYMALFSMLCIGIPSAWVLGIGLGFGLIGIYLAYVMDEVIRAIFMWFRWKSPLWENKTAYLERTG